MWRLINPPGPSEEGGHRETLPCVRPEQLVTGLNLRFRGCDTVLCHHRPSLPSLVLNPRRRGRRGRCTCSPLTLELAAPVQVPRPGRMGPGRVVTFRLFVPGRRRGERRGQSETLRRAFPSTSACGCDSSHTGVRSPRQLGWMTLGDPGDSLTSPPGAAGSESCVGSASARFLKRTWPSGCRGLRPLRGFEPVRGEEGLDGGAGLHRAK